MDINLTVNLHFLPITVIYSSNRNKYGFEAINKLNNNSTENDL